MVDHHLGLPAEQTASLKLILLVEDNEANAEVLKEVLTQELGCVVCHVSNGMLALQAIEDITPNLMVLDYMLPGINGLHLYDLLHKRPGFERVPVLFVSAAPNGNELKDRHLPFLEKPFELEALLDTLHHLLES